MSKFEGGSGMAGDPYKIANEEHLSLVRNDLDKHFELLKDLDLSVLEEPEGFKTIGDEANPFTGTFDGKGKKIKNLKINRPTESHVGFFGVIGYDGVVRNIGLEDVHVEGEENVGGLVGANDGRIENSYATGNVEGEKDIGGLVGANDGRIENSYATGNVEGEENVGGLVGDNDGRIENSYATGNVEGEENVGGLMGWNNNGRIKNSYAMGKVKGEDNVGGLVGDNDGRIENSYATGNVEGEEHVGGLVGDNDGRIENSYASGKVEGSSEVGGFVGANYGRIIGKNYWQTQSGSVAQGVGLGSGPNVFGKADAELKALDAGETGWDEKIWEFEEGKYPRLKWQKPQAF